MIYATVNSSINRLTKCAKMQKEEQNKKDALNGNGECVGSNADREEAPRSTSSYNHGGRLKFFKDGKFILELERSREGERVSWVSVPRKTFWPPQGTAISTPTYRQGQESSTSLSVSDDNSSIQSSPWQRDHSWKQTSPLKNASKELCFYFKRSKKRLFRSRKRRRPYDNNSEVLKETKVISKKKKVSLLTIVQRLTDKFANSSPPRAEMVVSPRKRFLREMEKDSKVLVDDGCLKRSRGKATPNVGSPMRVNGNVEEAKTVRNNSYSITSLLADDRNIKKEPASSPSHFSPGNVGNVVQQQYCPVKTEDRWYTESVDRLRSIEINHPDKRLYTPYPPSYVPPFVYPYQIPPQYYPNLPRGFPGIPSVYPMHMPLHRDAPAPSCSWAAEPSRETEHRDENITDMPLNLSKHAG